MEDKDECLARIIQHDSSIDISQDGIGKFRDLKENMVNARQINTLNSDNHNGVKQFSSENVTDNENADELRTSSASKECVSTSSCKPQDAAHGSSVKSATDRPELPNFLQVENARASCTITPSNASTSGSSVPNNAIPTSPVREAPKQKQKANLKVKTEPQDDIKEYAESTMNELLGWYGLPKMDNNDTPKLSLKKPFRTTGTPPLSKARACIKSSFAKI
ncbi:hypothetical protein EGW08_020200, partial [Elysia chlorotica]